MPEPKVFPEPITFTDAQVTAACDLHLDNLRKLITWGAVTPVQSGGGRGRIRLWNLEHLLRIALTAAIFNATGFTLRLSHTIAYCLPGYIVLNVLHLMEFSIDAPDETSWLHPANRHAVSERDDWFLEVTNRRYVSLHLEKSDDPLCFGLLDRDCREFLSIFDLSRERKRSQAVPIHSGDGVKKLVVHYRLARWEKAWDWYADTDPESLAYRFIGEVDASEVAAAVNNPVSRLTINLSLAFRLAARRVLGLPVEYPDAQKSDAASAPVGPASEASHRGAHPGEAPLAEPDCRLESGSGQPGAQGSPRHLAPRRRRT